MARGLRSKPTQPVESDSAEKKYDIPGVDFHQSLTWRPGKAIPVADLLSRLQALRAQLSKFEDEQVDSRLWTTLAGDLAHANLLGHKDKGVRAWTISCIIDVLKVCAPDAPFQENALKVTSYKQIRASINPISGHFHRHHHHDNPSPRRSVECLQRTACLHSPLTVRNAEHSAPGRCRKSRPADYQPLLTRF